MMLSQKEVKHKCNVMQATKGSSKAEVSSAVNKELAASWNISNGIRIP